MHHICLGSSIVMYSLVMLSTWLAFLLSLHSSSQHASVTLVQRVEAACHVHSATPRRICNDLPTAVLHRLDFACKQGFKGILQLLTPLLQTRQL